MSESARATTNGKPAFWISGLHLVLLMNPDNTKNTNPPFYSKYTQCCANFSAAFSKSSLTHELLLSYNLKNQYKPLNSNQIYEQYRSSGFIARLTVQDAKALIDKQIPQDTRRHFYYKELRTLQEMRNAYKTLIEACALYIKDERAARNLYQQFQNFAAYEIVFLLSY